jgi:hypothetical protein
MTARQLSGSDRRVSLMASSKSSRVSMAAIGPFRAFSTTSRARVRAGVWLAQHLGYAEVTLTLFDDIPPVCLLAPML